MSSVTPTSEATRSAQQTPVKDEMAATALQIAKEFMLDASDAWQAGRTQKEKAALQAVDQIYAHSNQKPKVYICRSKQTNMVVQGDIIVISEESLRQLDEREVDAVVKHELGHDEQHPSKLLQVARRVGAWLKSVFKGPTAFIETTGFLIKDAIGSVLTRAAILIPGVWKARQSKMEEFNADRKAIEFGADPDALVSGLKKMDDHNRSLEDNSHKGILAVARKLGAIIKDDHPSLASRAHRIELAAASMKKSKPQIMH